MIHYFLPTAKNNYKAYLLKVPALLAIALVIASFNFFVKIDTHAQNTSTVINAQNLLIAHNVERKKVNLGDLTLSSKLSQSAQNKAQKLLESNCWSHYCPDGESPWDFFKEAGYDYVVAGENLAEGFYNIPDLMVAWMNSESHRDNILNSQYKDVGFGIVTGNYQGIENNVVVVVHFGTESQEVIQDVSRQLVINTPQNGDILKQSSTKVEGSVVGLDEVNIFLNGVVSGKADIASGLFAYNLSNLKEGDNYIYAESPLAYGLSKDSNVIKVSYQPEPVQNLLVADQTISVTSSGISTTPNLKNIINIAFVALLAFLFLLDFIVLSRTQILSQERSFSHYHFGIFLILVIIILAGGFSGSLASAISI